jgi:hypothetical protein
MKMRGTVDAGRFVALTGRGAMHEQSMRKQ